MLSRCHPAEHSGTVMCTSMLLFCSTCAPPMCMLHFKLSKLKFCYTASGADAQVCSNSFSTAPSKSFHRKFPRRSEYGLELFSHSALHIEPALTVGNKIGLWGQKTFHATWISLNPHVFEKGCINIHQRRK